MEPACDGRSATNDEDCEVGADGLVRAEVICRATAAREVVSRAPLEENKRKASGGGKRTVALSCGDAAQLGGRLEVASTSRDAWRLRAGVEAVAMFFASLTPRWLWLRVASLGLRRRLRFASLR